MRKEEKEREEKVFICPSFILSFDGSMLLSPLAKLPSRFKPYQTLSLSLSLRHTRTHTHSLSSTRSHPCIHFAFSLTHFVLSGSQSFLVPLTSLSLPLSLSFTPTPARTHTLSRLVDSRSLEAHPRTHIFSSHFFSNTGTLTHPHSHATVASWRQNRGKFYKTQNSKKHILNILFK